MATEFSKNDRVKIRSKYYTHYVDWFGASVLRIVDVYDKTATVSVIECPSDKYIGLNTDVRLEELEIVELEYIENDE